MLIVIIYFIAIMMHNFKISISFFFNSQSNRVRYILSLSSTKKQRNWGTHSRSHCEQAASKFETQLSLAPKAVILTLYDKIYQV